MKLEPIPASHVDFAWRDGAYKLAEACDTSGGEITGDQLKLLISRGERTLIRVVVDEKTAGWGVVRIDQLPNMRVFFIADVYAPKVGLVGMMEEAKKMAAAHGCSEVRWAAGEAQERLFKRKIKGCRNLYQIMGVRI